MRDVSPCTPSLVSFPPFPPCCSSHTRKRRSLLTLDPRPGDVRDLAVFSLSVPFAQSQRSPIAFSQASDCASTLALAMNTMVARFDRKSRPARVRSERNSITCPKEGMGWDKTNGSPIPQAHQARASVIPVRISQQSDSPIAQGARGVVQQAPSYKPHARRPRLSNKFQVFAAAIQTHSWRPTCSGAEPAQSPHARAMHASHLSAFQGSRRRKPHGWHSALQRQCSLPLPLSASQAPQRPATPL